MGENTLVSALPRLKGQALIQAHLVRLSYLLHHLDLVLARPGQKRSVQLVPAWDGGNDPDDVKVGSGQGLPVAEQHRQHQAGEAEKLGGGLICAIPLL